MDTDSLLDLVWKDASDKELQAQVHAADGLMESTLRLQRAVRDTGLRRTPLAKTQEMLGCTAGVGTRNIRYGKYERKICSKAKEGVKL